MTRVAVADDTSAVADDTSAVADDTSAATPCTGTRINRCTGTRSNRCTSTITRQQAPVTMSTRDNEHP